jgi:iron complex transport system permease protein
LLSGVFSDDYPIIHTVVWDLRVPRIAICLLVGSSLGLAGALIQLATRNPLGDPQLFGLGGGAAIIQSLSIAGVVVLNPWSLISLSIIGSIATAFFITFFSSKAQISQSRLALIGVSFSAIFVALSMGIFAEARVFSQQTIHFIGGSMSNRVLDNVLPTLPFILLGVLMVIPVANRLNLLNLGDRIAYSLGGKPTQTRVIAMTAAGIFSGIAVSLAGLVGFVGLVIPHLARLLVGHDAKAILFISAPLGAVLVLYADQIARLAFAPSEIPFGMVTTLVGAPLMILIARRL